MDFTCPRCDFCSPRKQDLFRHVSRKVACTPSKGDIDLTDLKMQFQSSSKAKTIFECDTCSKIFKYSSGLSRHKQICSPRQDPIKNEKLDKDDQNMIKNIIQEVSKTVDFLRTQPQRVHTKKEDGYIYLIIEREFINHVSPVIKIGRTGNFFKRFRAYPKGSSQSSRRSASLDFFGMSMFASFKNSCNCAIVNGAIVHWVYYYNV